ncbi:glycosyltransferase [Oscillatoria amoena NRMC-F 0135]|nr:glycosyltransferase [Oscillatoria amoena NRMC-F 0135]
MSMIVPGIFILYYLLLLFLLLGWRSGQLCGTPPAIRISVVIPVRNEEQSITPLLDDLAGQTFPPHEVIVVDDHSTDGTLAVINARMQGNQTFPLKVIRLSEGASGKKKAITTAVDFAQGDIIATTDGDCRVGTEWIHSIAGCFTSEGMKLVAGAVRLKADTFFGEMQQLEQAALTGITATFITFRMPVMCNGANLAYRKSLFNEVNGYGGNEHMASGDDEFLLKKVAGRYPGGVFFNPDSRSIVTTPQAKSVSEFVNQRVRWAGKWRQAGFGASAFLAMFVFIFHLTYLLIPLWAMGWVLSLSTLSLLVLIKLLLEFILLMRINRWMNVPFNIHAFVALQFFYSPYVVFFGLISNLLRATWKGRKI